jgi:plastocyanin
MKTNIIIAAFVLVLFALAVYVYLVYPMPDEDQVNLQQLQKQQLDQQNKNLETIQKFSPSSSPNTLTTSPAVLAISELVRIANGKFLPATLTIKKGSTIVWENDDLVAHLVVSKTKDDLKNIAFASSPMRPGDQYSFTFLKTGTYAYNCEYHPGMSGTINVVD